MWVGRMASLQAPPASTSSTHPPPLLPAIFSTPLSLLPRRAADKKCSSSSSRSCNGSRLRPVSSFLSGGRGSGGFPVALASTGRRQGKSAPGYVGVEGDEDYDEWEDEDGGDEGDGPAVPFDEMRRWLRNKPAGFGEGKSYDTAVEDRLLEEMEQSRTAQLANIGKLKNGVAGQARPMEQRPPRVDETEVAPGNARVRVRGLPRKQNIHKDLKLAFKRFPSIVNISPAVVGNKKTRDPICKGFAFIDFDSDEAANKFVQTYSKQSVLFGKVQKEITCDVINTFHSSNPGSGKSSQHSLFTWQQPTDFQGEASTEPNLKVSSQDLEQKDSEVLNEFGISCTEENYVKVMTEDQPSLLLVDTTVDIGYSHESFLISEESQGFGNGEEAAESGSSKQKQKAQMVSRRKSGKTKSDKAPKLSMPRSFARLKVKERAVLTGVLSKYGEQAVPDFSKNS
uniref:RNA-binding motif, single-stranded-interacting protein 1 n=1 Tax=Anthurium amnicola TaxID=1678845 RepID=A0A1D1YHP2_9ARAE